MPQTVEGRPVFARFYARVAGPGLERAGVTVYRWQLLDGVSGVVIESGTGLAFPHYPHRVTRLVAVEPEPRLRALGAQAAKAAPFPIKVVDGTAEHLPCADGSFDAAVVCLTLCSVADQAAALAEIHRVLRPGGRLRLFEHVQADSHRMQRVQRLVDATFWPLLMGGCHTGRDTAAAITGAGFTITELDRFPFLDITFPSPAATHVLGTATRPHPGRAEQR